MIQAYWLRLVSTLAFTVHVFQLVLSFSRATRTARSTLHEVQGVAIIKRKEWGS